MPMERLTMKKVREVLRLKYECHLSNRKIALSCDISRECVRDYLRRVTEAKLTWPLPLDVNDDERLGAYLFPPASATKGKPHYPDWRWVHQELKKKGVTRSLLWDEYRSQQVEGISYSQFCDLYRRFQQTLDVTMRQTHKAGEKLFIDYSGMKVPWIDPDSGEIFEAEIFVATLGASNYTFAEATASQKMPDWIASHVRAFEFFGGVPELLIPDNLKSGVTKAHRYEPTLNATYEDMAHHYCTAIVPARPVEPQDKAKVEAAVKHVEQTILAKLRHHTFTSLHEINEAIKPLLDALNEKPFQKMPGSRQSDFEAIDKPAMKALPSYRYEYAEWKKVRAGVDYHVALNFHYYSVPYHYTKKELDLRVTATVVQCFYQNKMIAMHRRDDRKGHTTVTEHMPKAHQAQAEWTPERLLRWATQNGEKTHQLIQAMIEAKVHPQQAFRACLGVMRLGKQYGTDRLEKAAQRALELGSLSYKSMESMLKNGLDKLPLPSDSVSLLTPPIAHDNLRGADYYH